MKFRMAFIVGLLQSNDESKAITRVGDLRRVEESTSPVARRLICMRPSTLLDTVIAEVSGLW
jgi:hypothetical protein